MPTSLESDHLLIEHIHNMVDHLGPFPELIVQAHQPIYAFDPLHEPIPEEDFYIQPPYPLYSTLNTALSQLGNFPNIRKAIADIVNSDPSLLNVYNNEGFTPLHVAVRHNELAAVELLVASGAAINRLDDHQKTPLDYTDEVANGIDIENFLLLYQAEHGPGYEAEEDSEYSYGNDQGYDESIDNSEYNYNEPLPNDDDNPAEAPQGGLLDNLNEMLVESSGNAHDDVFETAPLLTHSAPLQSPPANVTFTSSVINPIFMVDPDEDIDEFIKLSFS